MERTIKTASKTKDANQIILFDGKANRLKSFDPTTGEAKMFHEEKVKDLVTFSAVSMDPYIYVIGKDKLVQRLNFRAKTSKWERIQDTVVYHGLRPPIVSLLGSVFVIGGSRQASTKVVEKFDPDANRWLKLKDKSDEITAATLVSFDDSIYCIGGSDGSRCVTSFCKFTPSSSEWVNLEPMKIAKARCAAVVVDRSVLAMGGWDSGLYERLKEVECYDIASGQWTFLAPMVEGHASCNAHQVDGWVFLVHGEKIEKYDTTNNNWQRVNKTIRASFNACWSITIPSC